MTKFSEAFAAWRRGDRRVAPAGARGRVYVKKKTGQAASGLVRVGRRPKVRMGIKVTRAEDGSVEHYGSTFKKVSWRTYFSMLWNRFVRKEGLGSDG